CHTAGIRIDDNGREYERLFALYESYNEWTLLRAELRGNLIAHPTVMMRRSSFAKVGPYDEGFACDYAFWLKAAGRLRFGYLPEALVSYRVHEKSSSTSSTGASRSRDEGHRVRS